MTTRHDRDRGLTLVEVLVAVVLLGVGVTAIMSLFAQTIAGTDRHRSMVAAEAWAQSAGDYLTANVPRLPCWIPGASTILPAYYEYYIRAGTVNSEGWPASNIRVVPPVQYWNGSAFGSGSSFCVETADATGLRAQLITIRVTSPDGQVSRNLTVVKGP